MYVWDILFVQGLESTHEYELLLRIRVESMLTWSVLFWLKINLYMSDFDIKVGAHHRPEEKMVSLEQHSDPQQELEYHMQRINEMALADEGALL